MFCENVDITDVMCWGTENIVHCFCYDINESIPGKAEIGSYDCFANNALSVTFLYGDVFLLHDFHEINK